MNREPDFEASADMRLLELQRSALGLTAPEPTLWQNRLSSEPALGLEEAPPPPGRGAVIAVEAVASPATGVIAGAVVTLSLSLVNDGSAPATNLVVSVPLPGGAIYRPGSFAHDGRPASDDAAAALMGNGLAFKELPPGARATFVWRIGVKLGSAPLIVSPSVRAAGCAVIGAKPLSIARKEQGATAFSADLAGAQAALYEPKPLIPVEIPSTELPIYELDEEEQLVYEAADAALSPVRERVTVSEAEPAPAFIREPEPEAEPEPARVATMLYGRFDRTTLAFFQRTFNGTKPPTILAHCIFAGALACTADAGGADSASLKRHLDAQSQVLHRIGLHEKLGKKEPIGEYAGELLAQIDRLAATQLSDPQAQRDTILLAAEISEPTHNVLRKIDEERDRWDFVKARQLTLALQAQRAIGATEPSGATLENSLRAYAQGSMTALQKLFVRVRLDRSTGVLFAPEPALDQAARAVLAHFDAYFATN